MSAKAGNEVINHHRLLVISFTAILFLLCAPCFHAYARTSDNDKALVLTHVAEDFPAWRVSYASPYGAGRWRDESARHVSVGLFQVQNHVLYQKILHVLVNPLLAGEEIHYDETNLAPLPISARTVEQIGHLTSDELTHTIGNCIDVDTLPDCAEAFLNADEQWTQLGVFSDKLIGVTSNQQEEQRILMAYWNGQAYHQMRMSPMQERFFALSEYHSNGDNLELMLDDGLIYISCAGEMPRIVGINTGFGVWNICDRFIWREEDWSYYKNNNQYFPGTTTFALSLTEMDLSAIPLTNRDVLTAIDASEWACVRQNNAAMRDAPDGNVIASCYTRLFGFIKQDRKDWVLLRFGSEENGAEGWFRREDLAFARDGYFIPCGFPSYADENRDVTHLNDVLQGLPAPLSDDEHLVWLVGQKTTGEWLVLVDADKLCTAAPDAFSAIGKPEESDAPRFFYHWSNEDDEGQWMMEYVADERGLSFLRICMENEMFVRSAFPPYCYLEEGHSGFEIRMDYLPAATVDWEDETTESHVWMTFEYVEGTWLLTECTDELTWRAEWKNGRFVFTDYDRPGAEWEWQAALDPNLMTLDFSELSALIDQYNALTPNRPSLQASLY